MEESEGGNHELMGTSSQINQDYLLLPNRMRSQDRN